MFDMFDNKNEPIWNAGLYVRLSKEDGDKEVSNSINNQLDLLNFYANDIGEVFIHDTYIDDGYTGTNFERPSFKRMIKDIEDKKINCIIAKDLSRLGRDYLGLGEYLENYFPSKNIRVVIVNDNLDSYKRPDEFSGMIVQIKNLFNQQYARDASRKIRAVQDIKRKKGEFIGSFAPYGYLKDPNDKNKLVIDPYAASIVKQIFNWFAEGYSYVSIVNLLNDRGVLCPLEYKKSLGLQLNLPRQSNIKPLWSTTSIKRIIQSEMYIGNMVQKKTTLKGYREKKQVQLSKDDWIVVKNTHEPIIEKELFDKVQSSTIKGIRSTNKNDKYYLYSGIIRCADCGRIMNRQVMKNKNGGHRYYYICTTYKLMSSKYCSRHGINIKKLNDIVLNTINMYIDLAVNIEDAINMIDNAPINKSGFDNNIDKLIVQKEKELSKINEIKSGLYMDWKSDVITKDEFISFKKDYEQKALDIRKALDKLSEDKNKESKTPYDDCLNTFKKYRGIDKLDRQIVVELIEKILVHENKKLTIVFKFQDEFEELLKYIEQNKDMIDSTKFDDDSIISNTLRK